MALVHLVGRALGREPEYLLIEAIIIKNFFKKYLFSLTILWSLSKNWALIHLFTELDKAMVHVIRLASCLWLWFHSACPLMPSLSDYHLTWVSLTLDVRYFFTAAPAKCSCHSSPWTWHRSSLPCSCAIRLVKAVVFPVVMYGCESWTIKKAEHRRIDAFELWCWRRLLRVLWTARRSNQSILKEISPGCSLEGLMLKLKLQYFGHLMRRADSVEKTLMLEKIEGRRRRGWQRMRWLDGITD